ncbi:MAG: murein biosynthesis integral membrane protein MurJ, partial [Duodenibacillus sp.]|nr:murein biosynthesis integral membrane protein MurJ [Duodenibacillus sp.]
FGVSASTDVFYVAFRIPNLLRRLFAEGAFSQAFVPMLSQVRAAGDEARTGEFLSHVFTLLAAAVLLTSVAGALAAPAVVYVIATGFAKDPATFTLAVAMTRVMFPYIVFMSLVAFAAAVLNTWKHFAVPAFTPVLLNLSFIACILTITPLFEEPVWALAAAVLIGGALQLAAQAAQLRRMGLLPRPSRLKEAAADLDVRRVLRLMVPAILGVAVAPLSILINTNIASRLASGAVTWLSYADRLMEFPTAILGVALGTVLLPSLSAAFAAGDAPRYNLLLDRGLRLVLLLAAPAAVGLGLLAEGLAAVLYQGRSFTAFDVAQSALAMKGYAVGLIGLIGIKIIAPAFYARKDIKTPVKAAVASVIAVQACNLATVPLFSHAGLALSVAVGSCLNAGALLAVLLRRGWFVRLEGWGAYCLRVAFAAAALAAYLVWVQQGVDWAAMQPRWLLRIGCVAGVIAGAVAVYFGALLAAGWRGRELREARGL